MELTFNEGCLVCLAIVTFFLVGVAAFEGIGRLIIRWWRI